MANAFSYALGALGDFASGVMANASSSGAYKRQIGLMQEQARLNYEYAEKSARNAPTWNRAGLETAGYNPMLAVQNATAGVNSSWASQAQSSPTDYAGNLTATSNATALKQRVQNETEQTQSTVRANEAQSFKAEQEGLSEQIKNGYLNQREQAEIGEIEKNTAKLESESRYNDAAIEAIDKNLALQEKVAMLDYSARIYGANQGFEGTVYNANTMKNIADAHSPSGKSMSFQNYTGGIRNILSGVGDVLHGSTNNYEHYTDSGTETSYDKKSGTKTTYKSTVSGRRKRR